MTRTALLIRPITIPDESPNGVLLRAAFCNGWDSPTFLMRAFRHEYRRSYLTVPATLQRVFDDMGIAADASVVTFSRGRDFFSAWAGLLRITYCVPTPHQCVLLAFAPVTTSVENGHTD